MSRQPHNRSLSRHRPPNRATTRGFSTTRGFTLLELLVAVALLAMLGVAAALTLNSTLLNEQLVGSRITQLQQLQRFHTLLRRDLEQIVNRQGRSALGDPRDQSLVANASGTDDSEGVLLDFYKGGRRILSHRPPSSHLERVRYRFSGGQLIREVRPYTESADIDSWFGGALIDQLDNVQLQVFVDNGWNDQWPPLRSNAPTPTLPQAVTLVLESSDFGTIPLSILLPDSL